MRCLMCGKELGESSLRDIIIGEDPLCMQCRQKWKKIGWNYTVNGVAGYSEYEYDEAFSACLIQYKECGDEALKDIFLYGLQKKIQRKYRGWTMCLMPSAEQKIRRRGFSHLSLMFASLNMPIIEPFEKQTDETQKTLNYGERQEMSRSIILKKDAVLPHKIVLCDDVITTGATIKGALRAIEKDSHQIQIFTLSAAMKQERQKQGEEWA